MLQAPLCTHRFNRRYPPAPADRALRPRTLALSPQPPERACWGHGDGRPGLAQHGPALSGLGRKETTAISRCPAGRAALCAVSDIAGSLLDGERMWITQNKTHTPPPAPGGSNEEAGELRETGAWPRRGGERRGVQGSRAACGKAAAEDGVCLNHGGLCTHLRGKGTANSSTGNSCSSLKDRKGISGAKRAAQ